MRPDGTGRDGRRTGRPDPAKLQIAAFAVQRKNHPAMTEGQPPLDPSRVRDKDELAALLRQVRVQAGSPPVAGLARRYDNLSKAAVYRVLAGKQLPSAPFLRSFLAAHGIDDAAQTPWLLAQDRLNPRRAGPSPDEAEPPAVEAPTPPTRRRLLIGGAIVAVLTVASLGAYVGFRPSGQVPRCDPPGCTVEGGAVVLSGRVPRPPADHEPYILTRVDVVNRWYLGPAILPDGSGDWSTTVDIGNAEPQDKDRYFTICSYFLPSSAVPELTRLLSAHAPDGVSVDELPADRTELACVKAVRLKHT